MGKGERGRHVITITDQSNVIFHFCSCYALLQFFTVGVTCRRLPGQNHYGIAKATLCEKLGNCLDKGTMAL